MSTPEVLTAIEPVLEALESLEVGHYVSGSVAGMAYGHLRATADVDLVAALTPENVSALTERLSGRYYFEEKTIREAAASRGSFNLIHLETMMKVDVFVSGGGVHDHQAMARRRLDRFPGDPSRQVHFVSPEDLILAKLRWFKDGGEVSEQQYRDVLGVLQVQGEALEMDYLRQWADTLGLSELLDRAVKDATG